MEARLELGAEPLALRGKPAKAATVDERVARAAVAGRGTAAAHGVGQARSSLAETSGLGLGREVEGRLRVSPHPRDAGDAAGLRGRLVPRSTEDLVCAAVLRHGGGRAAAGEVFRASIRQSALRAPGSVLLLEAARVLVGRILLRDHPPHADPATRGQEQGSEPTKATQRGRVTTAPFL